MKLTRDVTQAECPWLHRDYKKGEEVFYFRGHTYGCISYTGVAVSAVEHEHPFFELPCDALGLDNRYVIPGEF